MVVDALGALVSASLQVLIDRLASPQFLDLFRSSTFEAAETMKLQLLSVNPVLTDAEEKQLVNPYVKIWVDELRETVYDAEDLLDLLHTQVLQFKVESQSHNNVDRVIEYLDSINPFTEKLSSRLDRINRRLSVLRKHTSPLGLEEGPDKRSQPHWTDLRRIPTSRLVNRSKVWGRDHHKEEIIRMLVPITPGEEVDQVRVIAIVGMAGVGKTTLSQILFNDDRIQSMFDRKYWVHVSEGSDVLHLTTKVYESIFDCNGGNRSLDMLHVQLNDERLCRNRVLLVLDDFWAESFFDWDLFKTPFAYWRHGSAILVTTRNENVAIAMRATMYFLSPLPYEDCWNIFAHHAFRNRDLEIDPALVEIGEKIARKCKGLPLAAKVLGSLLYSVTDAKEWNYVLQSKMWDLPVDKSNILPALRLSYQLLPSHLKACFAYCSVFPKGYEIDRLNLIHLWMAEGLLQPSKTKTMDKVGEVYLHELLSRSLLQRSIGNDLCVIMHDLISDLAQYVGGEFFPVFDDDNDKNIPEKVRHLSFLQDKLDAPEKFEAFHDHSQLRTFLPFRLSNFRQYGSSSHRVLNSLIPRYTSIRVLSLSGYPLTTLPGTIGKMKHLRYLNLSCTRIVQLPESAGLLYNLQTLLLSNCIYLTTLPKDMQNLIDLRYLDVTGAALTEMPPQFRRLKCLRHLSTFVVSRNAGSRISELGALLQLHDSLSIVNLQDVMDATDALEANLMGKIFLDKLVLKWTSAIHDPDNEADVLDKLKPHKNLKRLEIENYGGTIFPSWLGELSFSNMVSVHLIGCINSLTLPPLGKLSSLKVLLIANMESLERVGPEFYGNVNQPFRALEILTFEDMLIWEEWLPVEVEEFPSLKELHIQRCPELIGNLPTHLGSLNKLVISECHNLAGSLPRVPMLRDLQVTDCDALLALPEEMMPGNLRKVTICNCPSLQFFPAIGLSTTLESLHIRECRNLNLFLPEHAPYHYQQIKHLQLESSCDTLVTFPLSSFRALCDLHIQDCSNLQSLWLLEEFIEDLPHLEKIQLKDCPNLVSFPNGGLPTPHLRVLSIFKCENLLPQVEWGLHGMTLLDSFRIEGELIGLDSFPEEGLLPPCLTSLCISGLVNLTSLNQTGLEHLVFLKLLQINGCNMLQSLPAETLPNSLRSLIIVDCPLLVPLCQKETGDYWPFIAHIPSIVIDEEIIEITQ